MVTRKQKTKEGKRLPHTSDAQRCAMIDWLEIKENFELITGNYMLATNLLLRLCSVKLTCDSWKEIEEDRCLSGMITILFILSRC